MPSGQPAPKMVIYAPREVSLVKFYRSGGVGETNRFLARVERAWEFLHLDTEKEKISFLYEKIGEEVESEIDCHLEGKSATSQQILDILRKCYGEKKPFLPYGGYFITLNRERMRVSVPFPIG